MKLSSHRYDVDVIKGARPEMFPEDLGSLPSLVGSKDGACLGETGLLAYPKYLSSPLCSAGDSKSCLIPWP